MLPEAINPPKDIKKIKKKKLLIPIKTRKNAELKKINKDLLTKITDSK